MDCRRSLAAGAALVAASLLAAPSTARAGDPTLAEYVADGSRVFWVLWITDTHIDYVLPLVGPGGEEDRLRWALTEAFDVVGPAFVVNTGDLTDGTDGVLYTGHVDSEWAAYRGILDEAAMTPETYFDIPGNHDAYSQGDLAHYLASSMQGPATGTTQPSFRLDLPFGAYHVLGVATPGNDGASWPFDNAELTEAELDEAAAALADDLDARLVLVFGHHDLGSIDRGDAMSAAMAEAGAAHYFHGHEHDYGVRYDDGHGVLRTRLDSLGQGFSDETFAVIAVDADAVTVQPATAEDAWPLVVITAPTDGLVGPDDEVTDPYAPPVPASCAEAPVRALVFDLEPVTWAQLRVDDGPAEDMAQRPDRPEQWRGLFDATELEPGWHRLTVEAAGSRTRSTTVQVEVVEAPCSVGDEDPWPDGDADADADAEEEGDADADVDADADADADADLGSDADPDGRPDGDSDGGAVRHLGAGSAGCACRAATSARPGRGALARALAAHLR